MFFSYEGRTACTNRNLPLASGERSEPPNTTGTICFLASQKATSRTPTSRSWRRNPSENVKTRYIRRKSGRCTLYGSTGSASVKYLVEKYSSVQSQKAVAAYFSSKQLLPFGFAEQHSRSTVAFNHQDQCPQRGWPRFSRCDWTLDTITFQRYGSGSVVLTARIFWDISLPQICVLSQM